MENAGMRTLSPEGSCAGVRRRQTVGPAGASPGSTRPGWYRHPADDPFDVFTSGVLAGGEPRDLYPGTHRPYEAAWNDPSTSPHRVLPGEAIRHPGSPRSPTSVK